MKKLEKNTKRSMWLIVFAAALLVVAIYFKETLGIVKFLISAAAPVIAGLAVAFILNVPMRMFEYKVFAFMDKSKSKFVRAMRRPICLVITMVLVLVIVTLVVIVILPTFIDAVKSVIRSLSAYANALPSWVSKVADRLNISEEFIDKYVMDRETVMSKVAEYARKQVSTAVAATAGFTMSFISSVTKVFLSFVVAIYALCCKEKMLHFVNRMLRNFTNGEFAERTGKVASVAFKSFSGFIGGQFIDSLVLGVLCYIGMNLFRFPYPLVVSVVVCVAQLIPVVGGITSAVIGSLLMFTKSPLTALGFLIFIIVIQQLEGNFIYPKIVGKQVGLPGILVISAVIIGGETFGIAGVLIGIPLVSTIYALIKLAMDEKELKEKTTEESGILQVEVTKEE